MYSYVDDELNIGIVTVLECKRHMAMTAAFIHYTKECNNILNTYMVENIDCKTINQLPPLKD